MSQTFFIMLRRKLKSMFEPGAESMVLEIVCGIFDISPEEMMKTGELTKKLFFYPGVDDEEKAKGQIKAALSDMPKEHAFLAGVFISGLLRCNLAQQAQQQYMQQMAEGCEEPDGSCDSD